MTCNCNFGNMFLTWKSEISDTNYLSSIFSSLRVCKPHVVHSLQRPATTFKPLMVNGNNIDHLVTEYSAGNSELQTKHHTSHWTCRSMDAIRESSCLLCLKQCLGVFYGSKNIHMEAKVPTRTLS